MLPKSLLLNNLQHIFVSYIKLVLGLCLSVNLNAALKLPCGYVGIKLGVTPGFNHAKFNALKTSYLNYVNQEIATKFANQNIDLKDQLNVEKIKSSLLAEPTNFSYQSMRDKAIYGIIANCLRQNKINLKQVTICQSVRNEPYRMQVWLGQNAQRVFLQVNSRAIQDLNSFPRSDSAQVAARQLFQSAVVHEACHILHQDLAVRMLLTFDQQVAFTKLVEKRADLYSVFNSVNPLGVAGYLSNHVPAYNDFYDHRCHTDWFGLIQNLKQCYESPELRVAINYKAVVPSDIRDYTWPMVTHITE